MHLSHVSSKPSSWRMVPHTTLRIQLLCSNILSHSTLSPHSKHIRKHPLWVRLIPIDSSFIFAHAISGMAMVVFGQGLRSAAMIHASTNFSHTVAFRKRPSHRLVTDGVYA